MGHEPFKNPDDEENFVVDGDLTSNIPAEADYEAKLIDVTKDVSNKGNDMFVWCFQILRACGDGDTTHDTWEGKVYTALTDAAMWKVNEVLQALGLGEIVDGRIKADFSKAEAVNRLCIIEIEHDEYRGQPQAKINLVKEHPKGAGYKSSGPHGGVSSDTPPSPKDDDIPF